VAAPSSSARYAPRPAAKRAACPLGGGAEAGASTP
jgi:hypothetical protein